MIDAVKPSDVHLRAMTADDLVAAHGLCRTVEWPHRLEDWAFNFELGQGLVAERNGTVVHCGLKRNLPSGQAKPFV